MTLSVGQLNPASMLLPTGGTKSQPDTFSKEKLQESLDTAFKTVVMPVSAVSTISSLSSFIMTTVFKIENEFVDKLASITNRLAYFVNGIYGGTDNAVSKNTPGTVGYSLVALASVMGDKDTVYQLKGPGSSIDQLPGMLEDVAYNPKIKEIYKLEDGKEKTFNKYKGFWDSLEKTFTSFRVVCVDIAKDFFNETKSGGIINAFKKVFISGERTAEKNLVVSSLGLMLGSLLYIGTGFKKLGSSIRDLSGMHADLSLWNKGSSHSQDGKATGAGNLKYKFSGILYTLGSAVDLIYRWTGLDKLELAAVGLDNAGFMFMNWANATDNRANSKNEKTQKVENQPAIPQIAAVSAVT